MTIEDRDHDQVLPGKVQATVHSEIAWCSRRRNTAVYRLANAALAVSALLSALVGCAAVELPPPPTEKPLVPQAQAHVGVYYAPQVRTAVESQPLFASDIGATSVAWFRHAFGALFAETTELADDPPWRSRDLPLQAVVEVESMQFELSMGNDTNVPDRVSVAYRVCLYPADGQAAQCWTPSASHAHQRRMIECFDIRICLGPLVEGTIREAIAGFTSSAAATLTARAWASVPGPVVESAVDRSKSPRVGVLWWPANPNNVRRALLSDVEVGLVRRLAAADLPVASQREVRDALFPLMEPATQPTDETAFAALIARDDVRARLARHGLDYIVTFTGDTQAAQAEGFMLCGTAYGGGGCLGFMWRHETTVLDAALWTVDGGGPPLGVRSTASATRITPALLVPLTIIPAHSRDEACDLLGTNIVDAINLREASQTTPRTR
jgi:hypothetical protein